MVKAKKFISGQKLLITLEDLWSSFALQNCGTDEGHLVKGNIFQGGSKFCGRHESQSNNCEAGCVEQDGIPATDDHPLEDQHAFC